MSKSSQTSQKDTLNLCGTHQAIMANRHALSNVMRRIVVSQEGENSWSGDARVLGELYDKDKTLHLSFTYCLSPPPPPSLSTFQVYLFCQSSTATQIELVSFFLSLFFFYLSQKYVQYVFFLSLTVVFSVFLMQPCHYVKYCLSGLFVGLIAAECCVSCTSACILKQSQCSIIRHLTTLRADMPSSNATGNRSQLAWLPSNQRTGGPL